MDTSLLDTSPAIVSHTANREVLNYIAAHGGSFMQMLAEAWLRADVGNSTLLMMAFRRQYLEYEARYLANRIGAAA